MLFNSPQFLLVFLPLALLAYWLLIAARRSESAFAFLVLASLVFYAYWNPALLPLLVLSTVGNYLCGRLIYALAGPPALRQLVLVAGVLANLGVLAWFKYANFLLDNINVAFGLDLAGAQVLLPLAISFFTFQQIAFLVDVARDRAREPDFVHYCLFVSFFPQLIAGPIVHHSQVMPQFAAGPPEGQRWVMIEQGITLLIIGLFKKVVLADNLGLIVDPVFAAAEIQQTIGAADAWIGTAAFALQIYFDFSGYSDMAVGLGLLFGIRLPFNFASPYRARNIIEFWQRWHITLSTFLRDYLYIGLGGNRRGTARRYANLMITMLLGGLWHGASWNFVLWGGAHGLLLAINHGWRSLALPQPGNRFSRIVADGAAHVLVTVSVVILWIPFRCESLDGAIHLFSHLLPDGAAGPLIAGQTDMAYTLLLTINMSLDMQLQELPILLAFLLSCCLGVFVLPNSQLLAGLLAGPSAGRSMVKRKALIDCSRIVLLGCMALVSLICITRIHEFIYFQF